MSTISSERGTRVENLILRTLTVFITLFLLAPIAVIVIMSFGDGQYMTLPMPGVTLKWYSEFFHSSAWLSSLGHSLLLAILSTALSLILGTLAALGLNAERLPGRRIFETLFLAPMIMPAVIIGTGIYFVFAKLGLTDSWAGLVLAHTTLAVPFVVVNVGSSLTGMNRQLLRAASGMGATPFYTLRRVVLPLVLPGMISGGLFAFSTSLDEVVVTLMIAGPGQRTLPREMFTAARESLSPVLLAGATVMIVITTVLLILLQKTRKA